MNSLATLVPRDILLLMDFGKSYHLGRTIGNNLRWGDNSQKNIPASETCLKKILQAVIP